MQQYLEMLELAGSGNTAISQNGCETVGICDKLSRCLRALPVRSRKKENLPTLVRILNQSYDRIRISGGPA
jgi:hypothetical protein